MKTYKQIVKEYLRKLKDITHIPQKETEILLLYIIEQNIIWLHINYNKPCSIDTEQKLKKLIEKRSVNYPIEYITKKATFYGEIFKVEQGVLIPRPETEILVDKAIEILEKIENPTIIEIGTGSGIISIMIAKLIPTSKIIAVDINKKALILAEQNAIKHNVNNQITFLQSDLLSNISQDKFNVLISNPPYIASNFTLPLNVKYEPSNALFGGDIGDELLKKIIIEFSKKDIKYLLCEMGYDQKKPLNNFINKNISYKSLEFYKDLSNLDRGFILSV